MNGEKVHVPPFKTQGIKTKLVPLIKEHINMDDSTLWIEPFMGSAVVGLNIAPKKAIFADINPHIINFYNMLKNKQLNAQVVMEYLYKQGASLSEKGETYYYYIRERFNETHDPLDFLFLNRSCFNGMIRFNKSNHYNVPYGHKPQRFAKAYITKIVNQVKHFERMLADNEWTFLCQPFEETLSLADEKTFIYCDPPYIGRHVDYYDRWDEVSETRLCQCLFETGARFMLSTWDHNQYRENHYIDHIWKSCGKVTKDHYYHIGAKEKNRNVMTEALLMNYKAVNNNVALTNQPEHEQLSLAL
ncbi:MAG: Dam family site-specific DNA-(adenine-N6)-methyltransferase [Oscillospiraceae bacterium]|nr:Dam family site-specific DNA-(adenine-N6)-methyltransferase [Oscillospiraceae bacterium]